MKSAGTSFQIKCVALFFDTFFEPLALAVIVQVIGQGLIISGLGRTDAGLAGILVLAQPVVAALVSWLLPPTQHCVRS